MSDKSTEYLCEQVVLDILESAPELSEILKGHASDRVWTEAAQSIIAKADQQETVVPASQDSRRVVQVRVEVTFMSVIPEGDANALDAVWSKINKCILSPGNFMSLALYEFLHFTISGLSTSDMSRDEGRYLQSRVFSIYAVRR